jgi:ribosomal protein S18 acetylase RimI-like enzyme
MKLVRWKRFTWDLTEFSTPAPVLGVPYILRAAAQDDQKSTSEIVINAIAADTGWNNERGTVREWLASSIEHVFSSEHTPAVVITHGQRIIGASIFTTEMDAETQFISGPCVSPEYRNRSLGSALLHATLTQLRAAGLSRAAALVPSNVPASRFVYPKFGSVASECEFEPALARV